MNIINIYIGGKDNPFRLTDKSLRRSVCGEFKEMSLGLSDDYSIWAVHVNFSQSSWAIRFTEQTDAETFYNDIFDWASDVHLGCWAIDTREYSAL